MKVIPAIDLLDGSVVRLHKGDYENVTVYNENPLDEAQKFKSAGFDHIHIVDLNGARKGEFQNLNHILQIMDQLDLSVQTGGGIRSYKDAERLLKKGISKVICSSMAVKHPEQWLQLISDYPEQTVLGMDLKKGKIAYGGWLETSDEPISSFLEPMIKQGLSTVLSTDISRDGTLSGVNEELYQQLKKSFPELNFIASGGVSGVEDLGQLQQADLYGVVIGRAYYEEKISLQQMKQYHNT